MTQLREVFWNFLLILWCSSVSAIDFPKPEMVLFSTPAGSKLQPSQQFLNGTKGDQPRDLTVNLVIDSRKLYRSVMLDDLTNSLMQHNAQVIVVEMRLKGSPVASARFDVSSKSKLNISNWFSVQRLLYTTPFWVFNNGRSEQFAHFSIPGHNRGSFSRSFYIHYSDDDSCANDHGFMAVVERDMDHCIWSLASQAGFTDPPIFFYAKYDAPYMERVTGFADQLLVYMDHFI